MQPRSGCTLDSAALTDERFAVSERCPGDDSVRLTLSATVPEDNRKPEEIASDVTGADEMWVLGMTDEGTLALTRRGTAWAVEWFTSPVEFAPVLPLPAQPQHLPSQAAVSGDNTQLRWFDGAATHAFDLEAGIYQWTAAGAWGPGLTGGWSPDPEDHTARDWVLVPRAGGFAVLDHDTGTELRWLDAAVGAPGENQDFDDDDTAITGLSQIGDILYARSQGEIHAFKMRA